MWSQILFLNFCAQLLYFQKFLQNFISKLCPKIFSDVFSKIYPFLFSDLLLILSYDLYFHMLFIQIFCISQPKDLYSCFISQLNYISPMVPNLFISEPKTCTHVLYSAHISTLHKQAGLGHVQFRPDLDLYQIKILMCKSDYYNALAMRHGQIIQVLIGNV